MRTLPTLALLLSFMVVGVAQAVPVPKADLAVHTVPASRAERPGPEPPLPGRPSRHDYPRSFGRRVREPLERKKVSGGVRPGQRGSRPLLHLRHRRGHRAAGGLHGKIASVEDTTVVVEVATGVKMKMNRSAITEVKQ